jgi:hypothetical protein
VPAYDLNFNPPAPVVEVVVTHPVTSVNSGTLHGKVDSGADVTVIPERLVRQLKLTPKGRAWTRSYDGTYSQRPVYYARFIVEGFALPIVRCIAADRTNVLLGRNVLNRFIIVLDGKNLSCELRDP